MIKILFDNVRRCLIEFKNFTELFHCSQCWVECCVRLTTRPNISSNNLIYFISTHAYYQAFARCSHPVKSCKVKNSACLQDLRFLIISLYAGMSSIRSSFTLVLKWPSSSLRLIHFLVFPRFQVRPSSSNKARITIDATAFLFLVVVSQSAILLRKTCSEFGALLVVPRVLLRWRHWVCRNV